MSDVITSQTEPTAPMAGALSEGLLRVEALPPQGQISLRGDFSDGFRDAVCGITGTGFPDPLGAAESGDRALLWMSRDELLFLLPYEAATEALARLTPEAERAPGLDADLTGAVLDGATICNTVMESGAISNDSCSTSSETSEDEESEE